MNATHYQITLTIKIEGEHTRDDVALLINNAEDQFTDPMDGEGEPAEFAVTVTSGDFFEVVA